ncbi:hypothetical protein MKX03_009260, partial [Papaver bracteatum]
MFKSTHKEVMQQTDVGKHSMNNAKRWMDLRVSLGAVVWLPWVHNAHYEDEEVVLAREVSRKRIYFRGVVDKKYEVFYLGERCLRQVSSLITIPCPPPDFANTKTEDIVERVHYLIANDIEYVGWWTTISMGPLLPDLSRVHNQEEVGIGNIRSSHFVHNVPAPSQFVETFVYTQPETPSTFPRIEWSFLYVNSDGIREIHHLTNITHRRDRSNIHGTE